MLIEFGQFRDSGTTVALVFGQFPFFRDGLAAITAAKINYTSQSLLGRFYQLHNIRLYVVAQNPPLSFV